MDVESIPFVEILGVRLRKLSLEQCLERCDAAIAERAAEPVATSNLDFVLLARSDPEFRALLNRSLNVADGVPLLWAARLLGSPLSGRVNGTDLVSALCARAAQRGWRVFFLGSDPAINSEGRRRLEAANPGLVTAGDSPMVDLADDEGSRAIAAKVREFGAAILFACLGMSKQERWLDRYLAQTGAAVGVGVGGALDILAGKYRRAPRWMQRSGLEWAFRLTQQPGYLWRRYVKDVAFFWFFGGQLVRHWARRLCRRSGAPSAH